MQNVSKNHIHGAMTWYEVMEWVPLEYDIFKFMTYMNSEREGLIHSYLPVLWLYGDSEEDIPSRPRGLLASGEHILIFHDASLMENGGKGFMVTTQGIYDLKTGIKLLMPDIEDIQVYDNGSIEISKGEGVIKIKDANLSDDNALNHLAKLLKVICVRYAGNSQLWEEKMSTPRPTYKVYDICHKTGLQITPQTIICPSCGKNVSYGIKFCNYCGNRIENSKQKCSAADMVICKACGKSILASAKFCNFCGEINNREDGKYEM